MARLEVRLDGISDDDVEVPPYLKTRIMALLDEQRVRFRWLPFRYLSSRWALVVSVAGLAFFAGLLARELHLVNKWVRERPDVRTVVLEYKAPDARDVSLVGDFNGWGQEADPVQAEKVDGRWVFRVELGPGRYQYAFVVDGKTWLPDPNSAGTVPDGFGGRNSVIYVQQGPLSGGRPL
jgi:hypothetical protein